MVKRIAAVLLTMNFAAEFASLSDSPYMATLNCRSTTACHLVLRVPSTGDSMNSFAACRTASPSDRSVPEYDLPFFLSEGVKIPIGWNDSASKKRA